MSHFEIFGLYLVLNLILVLTLIIGVIRIRLSGQIPIGDGGQANLIQAGRAHGNLIENAPIVLIGMLSMMQLGTSSLMLHVVGATFFIGRVLHAFGMTRENTSNKPRQLGMMLTLLTYLILIIYLGFLIVQSRGSYGIS